MARFGTREGHDMSLQVGLWLVLGGANFCCRVAQEDNPWYG